MQNFTSPNTVILSHAGQEISMYTFQDGAKRWTTSLYLLLGMTGDTPEGSPSGMVTVTLKLFFAVEVS